LRIAGVAWRDWDESMSATDKVRASIAEEAAEWFVANRGGPTDSLQRATFGEWLKTSPLHVEEYLGVALVAQDLRQAANLGVSVEELVAEARMSHHANIRPIATDTTRFVRRPAGTRWRFAAAAAAMLAAAALTVLWWNSDRASEVRYATRHGEQITRRLADNSVLRIDTDTAVTVRYSRKQRLVEVARGQVLFEVAHEGGRPFRVVAGPAEVVDVGTRFDVYLQHDSTLVTVLEGQVMVALAMRQHRESTGGRAVSVHGGEQIRVGNGILPSRATPADTQRRTAWLRRQIIFEQEPLETVAAEFNRYSSTPIEIDTPSLRALAISGTFSADDTESFVAFLKSLDGVKVEVTPSRVRVSSM
jgi:transmembrane sensor